MFYYYTQKTETYAIIMLEESGPCSVHMIYVVVFWVMKLCSLVGR
jgi:hypothetical protein